VSELDSLNLRHFGPDVAFICKTEGFTRNMGARSVSLSKLWTLTVTEDAIAAAFPGPTPLLDLITGADSQQFKCSKLNIARFCL
jgi:hypothetical protein